MGASPIEGMLEAVSDPTNAAQLSAYVVSGMARDALARIAALEAERDEARAELRRYEIDCANAHRRLTHAPFQLPTGDERGLFSLDGRLAELCGVLQSLQAKATDLSNEAYDYAEQPEDVVGQRDEARAELEHSNEHAAMLQMRVDELAEENARLREYVEHRYNCNVMTPGGDPESDPCTCGLARALAAALAPRPSGGAAETKGGE